MFAFRVLVPRKKYSLHLNLPFTAACDEDDAAEGTAADTAAANIFTLVKYATDAEAAAQKIAADSTAAETLALIKDASHDADES